MDDDDFRALIEILEGELRAIGAADIADERHYLRLDPDGGEARLPDPQKRLMEMLQAFERLLVVEDRGVYVSALARMDRAIRYDAPKGAVVELAGEPDRLGGFVDLSRAPDLREIREEAQTLIGRLAESRRLPPGHLT